MQWMPRFRILLARRPWIYWLFVVGVASGVALPVARFSSDVRQARESWGATETVFVATRAIAAGNPVGAAVEARQVPSAMVPEKAVRAIPDAAPATQRISPGEIIVDIDVSSANGPLALLPEGWLAITVDGPVNDTFSVGESACVLAGGKMIAPDAIVVRVLADGVVVGVPADVAAVVADAVTQRLAVIALAGR